MKAKAEADAEAALANPLDVFHSFLMDGKPFIGGHRQREVAGAGEAGAGRGRCRASRLLELARRRPRVSNTSARTPAAPN